MGDTPSTRLTSTNSSTTAALSAYACETDRLLAFELFVLHGAIAMAKALDSTSTGRPTADALAQFRKVLGPDGTRAPHPDEVLYSVHDSLIAEMFAARQVDNFLTYIVQLLTIVFAARPDLLRSQEQVRVDFVLSHPDRDSLVQALIERRVDRLAYLGMRDLEEDLQQRLGFALFRTPEDRETAVNLIEIRNVIVHNRGIVSKIAANRCPRLAPDVGKRLSLTLDKMTDHRAFFGNLVREIDHRAITQFKLESPSSTGSESNQPPNPPLQPTRSADVGD